MKERIISLGLVIIVAIFAGVTLTIQQVSNPILQKLLTQQAEILNTVNNLEARVKVLSSVAAGGGPSSAAPQMAAGAGAPGAMTSKIASLEKNIDKLTQLLNKISNPQQRKAPPQEDLKTVYQIDVSHSPVRGPTSAPVTITVFGDFQCPFSARFQPVVKEVLKAYPEKVNYVLKQFPLGFHPQARPASKAAFAANEQGKYWEMADALLANFKSLSPEKIEEIAKDIGLNMKQFKKDLEKNDAKYEKWIKEDMTLATKVKVRGTPTFYLNGKKTRARTLPAFKKEIDAILKGEK